MALPRYFYTTEFVKMGKWALLPADSENWHGPHTSRYFKRIFGFGKGTLILQSMQDDLQHAYFPRWYVDKLYAYIRALTKKDYLALAHKLEKFYPLKAQAKKAIPKIVTANLTQLSTAALVRVYERNRDWAHRVTPYDQFGWIAEDYWNPLMEHILTKKLGLEKTSPEYYRVFAVLTKPAHISTTLEEKRAVLAQAIQVFKHKRKLRSAAGTLAKQFGFMPVFTFGTPWSVTDYENELVVLLRQPIQKLILQHKELAAYAKVRNRDISTVRKLYKLETRDMQVFIDFGLVLDVRNEAEYLVSLAGFYLLPIYNEIAQRLALSVKQARSLYEDEIVASLQGKLDYHAVLASRREYCGWGFGKDMLKRRYFTQSEARDLFKHFEKSVKNLQGGSEAQGLCASAGKARGIARIVLSPAENVKVKKGNILITHATTVDYMPAIKQAGAIVTEVGGLTCHAAVVSREFGIPCVVALANATKNFKDGELVEVDANQGLVKKAS